MTIMDDISERRSKLSAAEQALLERLLRGELQGEKAVEVIRPRPKGGPVPVSFSQERLWFLNQLEPESSAYNIPGGLRLTGRLRVDVLEQSLSEIVRRH